MQSCEKGNEYSCKHLLRRPVDGPHRTETTKRERSGIATVTASDKQQKITKRESKQVETYFGCGNATMDLWVRFGENCQIDLAISPVLSNLSFRASVHVARIGDGDPGFAVAFAFLRAVEGDMMRTCSLTLLIIFLKASA